MFRKRRGKDDGSAEPIEIDDPIEGTVEADEADEADDGDTAVSIGSGTGPYDVADVDDPGAGGLRLDLGGIWLPSRPGLEVRIEADQTTGDVVAVTAVLGEGALQLQPFAAPRSEGIWDEVRTEIRAGITAQGGTVDEVTGPLGPELRTRVPARSADGSQTVQPARFVGMDGPRWFLRGVITGGPALDPDTDAELVALFRDVVVVRGTDPMAPRDLIPLRLPAVPDDDSSEGHSEALSPFERGPEITEIR
ncbi:MAG TPA: DUF3710 domain-containing protein [Actinomycetes bacterium]|nr:DUF3710 domain-containing protein [Actinomycetes bacterium]